MRISVTSTRSKVKVTDHLNFRQLVITAQFQVYLLRHFHVELKTDGWWTWTTAYLSSIFEFPSRKALTRVQTSPSVHISRNSNAHISVVHDATVAWLGRLVVLLVLYTLI